MPYSSESSHSEIGTAVSSRIMNAVYRRLRSHQVLETGARYVRNEERGTKNEELPGPAGGELLLRSAVSVVILVHALFPMVPHIQCFVFRSSFLTCSPTAVSWSAPIPRWCPTWSAEWPWPGRHPWGTLPS